MSELVSNWLRHDAAVKHDVHALRHMSEVLGVLGWRVGLGTGNCSGTLSSALSHTAHMANALSAFHGAMCQSIQAIRSTQQCECTPHAFVAKLALSYF